MGVHGRILLQTRKESKKAFREGMISPGGPKGRNGERYPGQGLAQKGRQSTRRLGDQLGRRKKAKGPFCFTWCLKQWAVNGRQPEEYPDLCYSRWKRRRSCWPIMVPGPVRMKVKLPSMHFIVLCNLIFLCLSSFPSLHCFPPSTMHPNHQPF